MQRQAVRMTVGGVPVDVPIGAFSAGQNVLYDGTQLRGGPAAAALVVANAFNTASAVPVDITGLTFAVARAGSYAFEFYCQHTLAAQPATIGFCINASANFTSCAAIGEIWSTATAFSYGTQVANNTPFTVAKTITTAGISYLRGRIVVSGACTLSLRCQTSASTLTVLAGSGGNIIEI